jgi:hypothetical protein
MFESTTEKNVAPTLVARPTPVQLSRQADWLVLGIYTLLALLITFPLVFQLGTNLRGGASTGDSYQNIWYMWWYGRALEQGLDPARSNLMYALLPDVQVLISSILNGLLMWPVIKIFGPLASYNFALLLSFPLAGFFTYKLALEVMPQKNRLAAFAAGFFFAFSTYHFFRIEGHLGLLTIQWLPFYLWQLFRLRRRPSYLNAGLAGLGFILAALSDLYYLGYFVLPVTVIFLAWYGLEDRKKFWRWKANLQYFTLALVLGAAVSLFFYKFFLNLDTDIRQSVSISSQDVRNFSADLLAYFLPTGQNPLFGSLTGPVYRTFLSPYPIEEGVFPGYILLILGLGGLFFRRLRSNANYFWLVLAGIGFVLSLGPRLHIAGNEFSLPLPYRFIYGALPLLGNFRAPDRLAIIVILALAILASFSLAAGLARIRTLQPAKSNGVWKFSSKPVFPILLVAAILGLSLLETLTFSLPFATDTVQVPQVYREIAAAPGDFKVLELPLDTNSQPLYYQTIHQKRLVGGLATRISNRMTLSWDQATYLGMFNPAESSGVINNGQALKAPGGPDIFPLDISFRQMLAENQIGYVTLHIGRAAFAWMRDYLVQQLGPPTHQETLYGEALLGWRLLPLADSTLPPVPPGQFRIRLGDGWNAGLGKSESGGLLRLVEQDGQLLVTPGAVGQATLSLRVTPYIRPQTVEVYLNGQLAGKIEGKAPWQGVNASLPLSLQAGQNTVQLHSVEGCLHPLDYIPNNDDQRCISFAVEGVGFK